MKNVTRSDTYYNGLVRAFERGGEDALDPNLTLADNPYKRAEHRQLWTKAFKEIRGIK